MKIIHPLSPFHISGRVHCGGGWGAIKHTARCSNVSFIRKVEKYKLLEFHFAMVRPRVRHKLTRVMLLNYLFGKDHLFWKFELFWQFSESLDKMPVDRDRLKIWDNGSTILWMCRPTCKAAIACSYIPLCSVWAANLFLFLLIIIPFCTCKTCGQLTT